MLLESVWKDEKSMEENDVVFVVYPKVQMHDDYKEFLWTPSALTLRKYLKYTRINPKRIHRMTYGVFKKFKTNMMSTEGDCTDFMEIFDQGDYAIPDEYAEAIMDGACDFVYELKQLLSVASVDLGYFTDPDSIKLKKMINKYLKKLKDLDKSGMVPDFKYKKIVKEYFGEGNDTK